MLRDDAGNEEDEGICYIIQGWCSPNCPRDGELWQKSNVEHCSTLLSVYHILFGDGGGGYSANAKQTWNSSSTQIAQKIIEFCALYFFVNSRLLILESFTALPQRTAVWVGPLKCGGISNDHIS